MTTPKWLLQVIWWSLYLPLTYDSKRRNLMIAIHSVVKHSTYFEEARPEPFSLPICIWNWKQFSGIEDGQWVGRLYLFYLWEGKLHVALATAHPHISKEHITEDHTAILLWAGSDCVRVGVHGGWKDRRPSAHTISIYRFKRWDYMYVWIFETVIKVNFINSPRKVTFWRDLTLQIVSTLVLKVHLAPTFIDMYQNQRGSSTHRYKSIR